ncbi:MAG: type II secretion system protein [Phycisphaerae bacterium]|jgi:prepilin-type N-terminal cleavage/methylation domain-containing protein
MKKQMAFTLVEILIVVLILGILAAIVLPKVSNAAATARASMLADDLRTFRTQLAVFKGQHNVAAGYPGCDPAVAPTEAALVLQMISASKGNGECAAAGTAGYPYGPYLREIPANPVNGKKTVEIIPDGGSLPGAADDSHGWVYQPSIDRLKADSQGSDNAGVAFFSY